TKNVINVLGLGEYVLEFACQNSVSTFGIAGQEARVQNARDPIFSPKELKTTTLITWSLPYVMPYKVIDLLMVSSKNTKYSVIQNDDPFFIEFMNSTEQFTVEVDDLANVEPGQNYQIRIVDFGGSIAAGERIPEQLHALGDHLTAVTLRGNTVTYYHQNEGRWEQIGKSVEVVSLGGERDAAKFAAIFAADDEQYRCNMGKAFQRLKYVTEVYGKKREEMERKHARDAIPTRCLDFIQQGNVQHNMARLLQNHQSAADSCVEHYASQPAFCGGFITTAREVISTNQLLHNNNCIPLY
ncbi:MAG: hypothetical protein AABX37_02400, partial [Nanoarchaeota archaeon]